MNIVEYNDNYKEDVKNLLVELQEFIASLDIDKYNILTDEYREKYFNKTIEEYFKSVNCKAILLDVFSFNESAKKFYIKNGYYNRVEEMMKKI